MQLIYSKNDLWTRAEIFVLSDKYLDILVEFLILCISLTTLLAFDQVKSRVVQEEQRNIMGAFKIQNQE